jgi:hypothetical protein
MEGLGEARKVSLREKGLHRAFDMALNRNQSARPDMLLSLHTIKRRRFHFVLGLPCLRINGCCIDFKAIDE